MKLRVPKRSKVPILHVKKIQAPGIEDDPIEQESEDMPEKARRGPKPFLGPCKKFSIYIPLKLEQEYEDFKEDLHTNKVRVKLSLATVLREGGKMYLLKKKLELKKALKGEFHAKKRNNN